MDKERFSKEAVLNFGKKVSNRVARVAAAGGLAALATAVPSDPLDAEAATRDCRNKVFITAPAGASFTVVADTPSGERITSTQVTDGKGVLEWTRPSNDTVNRQDAFRAVLYNPRFPDIKSNSRLICGHQGAAPIGRQKSASPPSSLKIEGGDKPIKIDADKYENFFWLPFSIIAGAAILGGAYLLGSRGRGGREVIEERVSRERADNRPNGTPPPRVVVNEPPVMQQRVNAGIPPTGETPQQPVIRTQRVGTIPGVTPAVTPAPLHPRTVDEIDCRVRRQSQNI